MLCPNCKKGQMRAYVHVQMQLDAADAFKITKQVISKRSTQLVSAYHDKASFVCNACGFVRGYPYDQMQNGTFNKENVFHIVFCKSRHDGGPSYVMNTKQGLYIQSGIYDASKFSNRENAVKLLGRCGNTFQDIAFDIMQVDKRIFGDNPRWVED